MPTLILLERPLYGTLHFLWGIRNTKRRAGMEENRKKNNETSRG
jgi:hypothetical protein